jgi:hypothetical protein
MIMNSPETNDPIDKLLREQDRYVNDDGFTRRVLERVPRRRHRVEARWVLAAMFVLGVFFAIRWLPWRELPPLDYAKLFSPDSEVLSAWLPVFMVVVALVSAGIAAVRRGD